MAEVEAMGGGTNTGTGQEMGTEGKEQAEDPSSSPILKAMDWGVVKERPPNLPMAISSEMGVGPFSDD